MTLGSTDASLKMLVKGPKSVATSIFNELSVLLRLVLRHHVKDAVTCHFRFLKTL